MVVFNFKYKEVSQVGLFDLLRNCSFDFVLIFSSTYKKNFVIVNYIVLFFHYAKQTRRNEISQPKVIDTKKIQSQFCNNRSYNIQRLCCSLL